MKIVFDLDNTLYSFEETGIDNFMRENIAKYIVEHMKLPMEEAVTLSNKYYAQYGLCIAGLAQHHGVDPEHYCEFIHKFDMSVVKKDEPLIAIMDQLTKDGHELWIFTNADMPHADRMLTGLGIKDFFLDTTGAIRGIDCFVQWEHSSPSFHNKPERSAYECAATRMNVQPGEPVVFLDDSEANLRAPKAMGWQTVWIAHDRSVPEDRKADWNHNVITNIYEFPKIIGDIVREAKKE